MTLTATADAGSVFSGWSGGGCTDTSDNCTVTMAADISVSAGFDIFTAGTFTASGTYTWNSGTSAITWDWTSSDFVCEGPPLGTETITGWTITSTTMTWPDMTWTRPSGTAGDIVGTWTASDTTGNSWTLTFNVDGTTSVVGNIVSCSG